MADEKVLNDLAALANGNFDVNDYANNMLSVLRQSIQNTYIDKFNSILEEYKESTKRSMSKEMQLLEAIRPFIDENSHNQMDGLSEMYNSVFAIQSLFSDLRSINPNASEQGKSTRQPLLKEDGVYEIDDSSNIMGQMGSINPTMLLLLLLLGQ